MLMQFDDGLAARVAVWQVNAYALQPGKVSMCALCGSATDTHMLGTCMRSLRV